MLHRTINVTILQPYNQCYTVRSGVFVSEKSCTLIGCRLVHLVQKGPLIRTAIPNSGEFRQDLKQV